MHKKLRKIIASVLLFTNISQIAVAALPVTNTHEQMKQYQRQVHNVPSQPNSPGINSSASDLQNLSLSTGQLGVTGPLNAGLNYSNLTGTYFNGQFLKQLSENMGLNVLGEYGDNQYRINGTLGFLLAAQTFFKISAEQLSQKLPFFFSSGSVDKQVKQNALGARFQHHIDLFLFENLSIGGYAAKAPNVRLAPVTFISNGNNCNGFEAGLRCINERNIAGADSTGADMGLGAYLTSRTYIEGKLYYDTVHYNTIFSYQSMYDRSGYGGGVSAQHLLASNIKLSAGAEIRKIYNTYNLALSWMPPFSNASGTELSLVAQRVVSHGQMSNDDTIGLKISFFADRVNYQAPVYGLNGAPIVNNIASWVSQPAVKMNQVLAISEEYTHLAATTINSISPNFGPLAGGNTIIIEGSNFLSGAMVRIGGKIATITSMTATSLTVIAPPGTESGGVPVTVTTPDGNTTTLPNGYLYTNGIAPIVNASNPAMGPTAGGTLVTITGANFAPGNTSVTIGGITIPANLVTVNSPISLTFTTPAHPSGTVLVTVTTPGGTSSPVPGGFTYEAAPTVASLAPSAGSTAGGTSVTITGTNFAIGDTRVIIDGVVIPAGSVTVNSPTSLTFSTPPHAAGNVAVSVATSGGNSDPVPGGFTYSNTAVTVTSLSPQYGSTSGGTVVTITGTNFVVGNTSVTIGGILVAAGLVTVNSSTSLTFTTPAHVAGNVEVSETTPVGTSGAVPGGFTYIDPPVANSLSPNVGPIAGGTSVTITGSNFIPGDTTVTIGGNLVPAGLVTVNSSTSLTFNTPAHAAGNVAVNTATSIGSSAAIPGGFTYTEAPTTSSLTPTIGSTSGGTSVTITGTNFVPGDTTVTIGGNLVSAGLVTVNSSTSLTFNTPAHAEGNVAVSVATSGGVSNTVPGGFTYASIPTTTSLTPIAGPIAGGTSVTITGTNFVVGNTSVTIGGIVVAAGSVTVNSSTSLTFNTPAHAAGNVAVSITSSGGASNAVPGGFTYEAPPTTTSLTPIAGSVLGGTSVTVTGTNFVVGDTTVTIGGNLIPAGSVVVNSPTSLTFSTPAHAAGNVAVSVATSGGVSNTIPGGFTYEAGPITTSLTPIAGPVAGGTLVTISGTGFVTGDTTVTIGGNLVPVGLVTVNSSTSLTFNTPAHAAGNVSVSVSTSAGSSNLVPGGFTYVAVPTAASLAPIAGPIVGGTLVTITGTNFVSGDTTVTIGGNLIPAGSVLVLTATTLTFSTPAHVAGNVAVSVATLGGSSNAVPGGFTYEDIPTTTSLTPTAGPIAGGTSVTITGTGFVSGDTAVVIGGNTVSAGLVTVNSSTSLTFSTPAHAVGNVAVSVATSGGSSGAVPGGFTYVDVPTTTSLAPTAGPIAGGTSVTIIGTGFVPGDTAVVIGGNTVPAGSVTVNSSTSLTFSTPAHSAGNVAVNVVTPGGSSNTVPGGFTYGSLPTTTSLTPAAGPIAGGTSVTIIGTNFIAGDTSVTIGGNLVPVGSVMVNSSTSLTFTTPAHAAGNVAVSVTSSVGSSNTVPGGFTYEDIPTTTSLTPLYGPISGGTPVTITGTNFVAGDTTVTIGGNLVPVGSVTVNSATSLTFSTPAHAAGNVAVNVTTSGGVSNAVPGGFTYEDVPTATSLTPTAGPTAGGTSVTVSGTNFVVGDTTVTIGGNLVPAGSVTVNSPVSLTFSTPAHAAGNVAVTIGTSGGFSSPVPGGFTYNDSAATAVSLTPTVGPVAGGTLVTITGTNFVPGDTSVTIGGNVVPAGSVTVNSATSLTFSTPAHAIGNVAVNVATSVGSSAPVPGGFTYEDVPTTTSLTPTAGPVAGGTLVTITGTNFTVGDTAVTIGGNLIPAGSVTVSSSTSLTFTTPAHVAGNVSVSVSNTVGGTSNNVPGGFTYTNAAVTATSLTPIAGPIAGGTLVSITGTNFVVGDTTVTIGGNLVPAGSVTVNSPTSLTFNTPAHVAGNVAVNVATSLGSSSAIPGGFTYEGIPTTTSLTPLYGPTTGGTSVTITGTNFAVGDTTVTIGGNLIPAGSVTVNSATSLTFSTPAHVAGNVAVNVSTSGGASNTVPGGFTYEDIPTATSLIPIAGPIAGGTLVTITGTNFVPGDTTVTIGGNLVSAGSVTVNSATSLTFSTPAHVAGNVSVGVANSVGSSAAVPGGFTYEDIPTATSLTPTAGPTAGGTSVTITGTNFVPGDTSVTIGGNLVPTGLVTVNSSTSLTFNTPAHSAGNVAVSVATSGGSSGVPGGFTYVAVPTTTSLAPIAGPIAGGTLVTITGTNFVAGGTTVTIGGIVVTAGSVTVNTPTSLTFSTPAHVAGNVAVSVATSGGVSNTVPGGFTYTSTPTTASLTPISGPVAGGTLVTITGTNFVTGDTTVTIGGNLVPAGSVTVNSSTLLTFSTPAHVAGNVAVSVATSGGVSNTVPGGFTYVAVPTTTSLTPIAGPIAGGTSVTITGTNFVVGDTTVTIGGNLIPAGSVTVNTPTSLTFSTPAHAAGNVAVSVATSGGVSNTVPGGFTYTSTPTTTSLTPIAGPVAGGTLVTITGTNFVTGNTTVTIGGNLVPAGSVTVNSSTSLTFSTPAHVAGNVAVSVATSGGASGSVPGGFTYEDIPTTTSLSPLYGPIAGGTSVTIIGTNFVVGDTTVTIGGNLIPAGSVTVNSPTSLTFSTPAHAVGNVAVSVATSGGGSNAVPGGFTYEGVPTTSSLTPIAGPIAGGTSVTITGTNFVSGDTSVTIGGNLVPAGSVTVNSSTSLTFNTPAHAAGNVAVNVATTGGGASNAVPGGFTYQLAPTATSLTPTSGTTAGGTSVTVSGSNFVVGNTSIVIGGNTVPATVNSSISLNFTTPAHAAGNVAVSIVTPGGVSNTVPGGFTYLAPSLQSCTAAIPSLLGIQLVTCVGANLTLFQTTFLKASGSAACSTFPTQSVVPTVNILGQTLVIANNIPGLLTLGLIGCNIELCSNSSCNILGGVAGPVLVSL